MHPDEHTPCCASGWCSLLLLLLTAAASARAAEPGFGAYQPAASYADSASTSLYVPMRDGVRIAVRVYRPLRGGVPVAERLPVIWQRTLSISEGMPGKAPPTEPGLRDVPGLTRWGYVVVEVARRGNGQSFGIRRGYNDRTESDDAYELTEWMAAQPWSNGQVGIYGCSNTGDAAMHAMEARPPHLQAVFAGCFSWSKYDAMRRGGIFAQWGTGPTRTVEQDVAIEPVDGDADKTLLRAAAQEHQLSTNLYEMWKALPYRDSWSTVVASRFWVEGSAGSFAAQLRQLDVPLYILGGWHDELRDQGIIALLNVPNSRIVIGPWKHCMNDAFPLFQEIHRFFDTYLKHLPTHLREEPRIHYYTMAGTAGAWHTATDWPVAGVQASRLFLRASALATRAARGESQRSFKVSDQVSCPGEGLGPFMQPCHVPGEGASYAGEILKQPLEVTGNPLAHLIISADRPDADLFAYLEDVAADGSVTEVTEGRLKASLRATATPPFKVPGTPWHRSYQQDAAPLTAGQPVTLDFDLMPTSYVFAKGHRVQLTLTGIDYRQRDRDARQNGATITVHSRAPDPSFISLTERAVGSADAAP